jgi:hypothetical protein
MLVELNVVEQRYRAVLNYTPAGFCVSTWP